MVVGANMAVRTDLARGLGWDVNLGAGRLGFAEDTLFWYQLRASGARITALDAVPAIHHFHAGRLSRSSWLSAAKKAGRSDGYVWHHWLHSQLRIPTLRYLKHALALALYRIKHPHPPAEGADPVELELVYRAHLMRGLARARRTAPRYGCRSR